MRTREYFTETKLYYDGRKVEVGDFLRSPAGSTYNITKVTKSKTHPQRRYCTVLRWPPDQVPDDATVHPIHWYPRKKRSARLSDLAARTA